jgi:predicted ArsR family transcriptional regulator
MRDTSLKQRILDELRKNECSISDLCRHFDLTRNAIKYHLDSLIQEGFIGSSVKHEPGRAGKPSRYFFVLSAREIELSKAYIPFLRATLDSFREQLAGDQFDAAVGKIADYLPQPEFDAGDSPLQRLRKAAELMDTLGALTEISRHHDHYELCSYSCPLGALVREYEPVCDAVARYFARVTGGEVTQQCDNQRERPFCHFLIRVLSEQADAVSD